MSTLATASGFPYPATTETADVQRDLKALADYLEAQLAWTAYTPVWTGSTTNPVIGNGTLQGAYCKIGKLVNFRASITLGSTTTVGAGAYGLSLPAVNTGATVTEQLVTGMFLDSSTGFYYRGVGRLAPSGATIGRAFFVDGAAGTVGWSATVPVVPASGDIITFCGSYQSV